MWKELRAALSTLLILSVICGLIYPLVITAIAQFMFSRQANGSLVEVNGTAVGSELLGQEFSGDRYFWGRLSATTPTYNGGASSGSNLGPLNPALVQNAKQRIDKLRAAGGDSTAAVPVDLATSSASGLDPHITPAGARYQIARVAKARGMTVEELTRLVDEQTEARALGIFGEARVNVLNLNLALDRHVAVTKGK